MALNRLIYRAFRYQAIEQQARIYTGGNNCGPPSFAACNYAGDAALFDDDLLDRVAEQDVDALFAAGMPRGLPPAVTDLPFDSISNCWR